MTVINCPGLCHPVKGSEIANVPDAESGDRHESDEVVSSHAMSRKPGRNDPCACGSGKKYKRCCLSKDEAAARERAQQQALFADDAAFDELDADEDDDPEEFYDVDQEAFVLDVGSITYVTYSRGFVKRLSDLETGRDLRVTEWEAPDIPQSVLDSIASEQIDALEGEWGEPDASDPIQVDLIDLEFTNDVISIEVFNRAMYLVREDSDEMRRIHRVCGALEAATPDRSEPVPGPADAAPAVAVFRRAETPPIEAATFDPSSILKEHRQQRGACELCGEDVSRRNAQSHASRCAPAHDLRNGPPQDLVQLRAMAPGLPAYWLDLEAKADAKLEALDAFLRRIWLECCGHLSAFTVGATRYFSRGYELGSSGFGVFGGHRPVERSMNARLRDALPVVGERFEYEYDFGSTTTLQLKVIGERTGRPGRHAVRLLARNTPPAWPCAVCGQPAAVVCAYCLSGDRNAFVCATHESEHACGETEGFLPVVNSPRVGVCGYTAET
jgi:hypothetical protein